jgi:hypothetical protein
MDMMARTRQQRTGSQGAPPRIDPSQMMPI